MSARAIWKGTLSFGLATLPVKVYKATDDPGDATATRMLHNDCKTPIHQHLHCDKCNKDIGYGDTVKGVDNGDGTFVVLSKDELDSIKPESSDVVALTSFVKAADIDSIYVRDTYYVTPDGKAGQDAYALLVGLCAEGFAGQGSWTIHGREHNVIVRPVDGTLMVQTMRTVNEVRSADQLPGYVAPGAVVVSKGMMDIGRQLRDAMAGTFDATEYEDSYADEFKKLVAAKKSGAVAVAPALKKVPAATGDLMAALQASLKDKPKRARVAKPTVGSGPKRTKGAKAAAQPVAA